MSQARIDTNSGPSSREQNAGLKMNIEVSTRYLRENFRLDDRLAVVLIQKDTHRVVQRIATAEKIAAPGFQAWLRHENAQRCEVYVSMNTIRPDSRGRTKDDIAEVRHVYLDFDDNGTAAVQALMQRNDVPTPNYLVNSSAGKWQVVWKVEGFGGEDAERLMRHLVRETGADPAATDSSRVLRLPGFMNHKYAKPFLVRVETRSERTYNPEHFPAAPNAGQGGRTVVGKEQTDRSRSSHSGISQSERDWAYAKRALARGDSPGTVIAAISQHRAGQKSDSHAYAARTVKKAGEALESDRASTRTGLDR
jgi:hypothetical protein